ncbi:MAG: M3 family metallopeptidase [Candidatus Vogelbacteria bacterium]|nr:M3 family metallopeptidase [Candidatus Vogelbacteria bacterium]
MFDNFVKNGQIDVYPKQNRSDGAFCTHMSANEPTYILLNYTDQLNDVTTLAHEFGHGLNNELIKQSQPELYFDTPVSTAEVASTFVEDFVLEEISKRASEETKLSLMMAKLDDDVATIFRQVAAYRFEQALHKNFRAQGYLSKKEIGNLFLENMKAYTGGAMEYPAGTENWWIYWSHFRNFFYVYSYASGLLISKSLQALVRKDQKNTSRVEKFLSAGTSDSPTTIFAELGLDIKDKNFWQQGLNEIENLLNETEKLYNSLAKKKK